MNYHGFGKKVAIIGLIIIIPVALWFMPPPITRCSPLDYNRGYAIIYFSDPLLNRAVPNVTLYIQYSGNGSTYLQTTSNTLFYAPETSWWFAMKPDYWNMSGVVMASQQLQTSMIFQVPCPEGDPYYNASYAMFRMCPKEYVQFHITAIDNLTGNFSSGEIPDGSHEIPLSFSSPAPWGLSCYIPTALIPAGSYAANYSMPAQALWIGWNGTVSDYRIIGYPSAYNIYDVGRYNSTYLLSFVYEGQFHIEGNFTAIASAVLYYGFLDDTTQQVIPF